MRLLLTHAYFLHEDPKEKAIMRPYPPLGILYVAAYLEEQGFANEVFDTTFSSKEAFRAYLLEHRPERIAFYVNLMTKLNVLESIRFIREEESLRSTTVILGGPDVRYNADHLLEYGADFLVVGEGEQTMAELMQALDGGKPEQLSAVDGITFRNAEGTIVKNPERKKFRGLDELPLPARDKIDLRQYLDTWKTHHGLSALSISTQRGCPYTCKWCSRGVYGLSYRRRAPAVVADELAHLVEEYNPDTFWFVDDVFTVSHKWMREFRDSLAERKVKIRYECITRADRMNEEVIQLLKETGCFRVWIGAESGSQKIIDLMDRRVDVNQVRDMIRKSRDYGIEAGTFIMLGYPGETEADIEETIHHLKTSNPDIFTITVAYPIRGTELFEEITVLEPERLPWESTTDRDIDFVRTYPRKYYDFAVRRVVNEVNYHKRVLNRSHVSLGGLNLKMRSTAARLGMWWHRQGVKPEAASPS